VEKACLLLDCGRQIPLLSGPRFEGKI
jgi:hypothetical protein